MPLRPSSFARSSASSASRRAVTLARLPPTASPPPPAAEAEPRAAEGGGLIGQSLGAEGGPAADARVGAVEFHPRPPPTLDRAAGPEWNGTTRTNEAGFYRIPARTGHPYSVRAGMR